MGIASIVLLLWSLAVFFVIPNGILFGASYLVSRPFTAPGSWQRVAATVAIAFLVAFGPRVPGMLSDLSHYKSGTSQREIVRATAVPAGSRIGWHVQLDKRSARKLAGDNLIQFRKRYFPAVRMSLEGSSGGPHLMSEDPIAPLREAGLIIDTSSPDDEDVVISMTGSLTGSHLVFDVQVTERGQVIGRYADRYRLRWPGMASNPRDFSLYSYLTQFSILDLFADAAFSGQMADQHRPVGSFLSEVVNVAPPPVDTSPSARTVARRVDGASLPLQTTAAAARTGNCRPSLKDYGLLQNADTGLVRQIRPEVTLGGAKYTGLSPTECTATGLAIVHRGSTPGAFAITEYDATLESTCTFTASVAADLIPANTESIPVRLSATRIGFQLDLLLKAGDKPTGEHILVDIQRPDSCQLDPPGATGTAAKVADTGSIWDQPSVETQELANRLSEPWDELLLQQSERARTNTLARCDVTDGPAGSIADASLATLSCLHRGASEWQEAILKLRLLLNGERRAFTFSESELAALGPVAPRVYYVKDRGMPAGPFGVGSMEPNTLLLRETDRPLILMLEKQTHRIWHLRKLPAVWLMQWNRTCPQPCPVGRQAVTTLGLGFTLGEPTGQDWGPMQHGLELQTVIVPESGTVTIGAGTGEFPDAPAPYDIYADQYVKSSTAQAGEAEQPDRFDKMVEAAAARSSQEQSVRRAQSFSDLRVGVGRLPSSLAIRDLALWSPEINVTVDYPARPVFIFFHGGTTESLTVQIRPGSRLAGVYLDKKAERLKLDLPRGVPIFGETASNGLTGSDALRLVMDKTLPEADFHGDYIAGKSELVIQ